MSESSAEYKARLHGYVGKRDPLAVLRETPALLRKLILRQPPELLARKPKGGKWSAAEILAHLADTELVLGYRIKSVLAENGRPIENVDQTLWSKSMRYEKVEPWKSVVRFRETRSWNLDLLAGLTPEEWSRYGVHSERGKESVRDMALLYAGHDLNHAAQIRDLVGRKIAALAGLPKAV
jgi:hypothetical protein